MFGATDFDMFGGLGGANLSGNAIQNLGMQLMPPSTPGMNQTGMGGVIGSMKLPAATNLGMNTGMTGMNAPGGGFLGNQGNNGLGFNLGTGQLILGGIQAIGSIMASMEANKLAREQFDFQKGVTNTNVANQIKSYNTTLSDRINARSFTEGREAGYADRYISDNKLVDQR